MPFLVLKTGNRKKTGKWKKVLFINIHAIKKYIIIFNKKKQNPIQKNGGKVQGRVSFHMSESGHCLAGFLVVCNGIRKNPDYQNYTGSRQLVIYFTLFYFYVQFRLHVFRYRSLVTTQDSRQKTNGFFESFNIFFPIPFSRFKKGLSGHLCFYSYLLFFPKFQINWTKNQNRNIFFANEKIVCPKIIICPIAALTFINQRRRQVKDQQIIRRH